jgi:hypothetical protein
LFNYDPFADGRWVEDDYYEDKALEEVTAKGLKPGDPVGELPDPQTVTSEAVSLATVQAKAERGGSGLGMYRAGGPTTIFGGTGLGPYSDGPHNAVRKSMLNREGLSEENWMFVIAQRTRDAEDEWTKTRKEALMPPSVILADGRGKEREKSTEGNAEETDTRKKGRDWVEQPLGVYEPHSGLIHCCVTDLFLFRFFFFFFVLTRFFKIEQTHNLPKVDGSLFQTRPKSDGCWVERKRAMALGAWRGWIPFWSCLGIASWI